MTKESSIPQPHVPRVPRVPRGTIDILPEEIPLWRDIEAEARRLLGTYNFREIRTPVFEETALFKRSLGQTSDVVNKQLLELVSSNEEGLALRPEGTASVVRSYIENSMDRREALTKLFYIGPMFRGERPQKGRLRQFHQIGVEAIGANTATPYLDAEIIALNVELLRTLGVRDFRLKINTLGSAQDKERFSGALRKALHADVAKLCEDCRDRFERNVFRILDCKNSDCRAVVAGLNPGHEHLSEESRNYYAGLKQILQGLGVEFEEVPSLVRGLDYYTHTVFEITQPSLGSQDAVSAGGRYNNLVAQLGGPQVDAVGFACGVERILLAMPAVPPGTKPPQDRLKAYVIALDQNVFPKAFGILQRLRRAGIAGDISYKASSMKSQMRAADKSGSRYVVILGEEEEKKGVVALKDMTTGEQREVKEEKLITILQG
ncbi:MAG: histidine--tRNA ligase [Candidatus Omnitrophica bacterium]|nr:histidine--tRNA ligase [Candidatus Omnitrophota bacterium]